MATPKSSDIVLATRRDYKPLEDTGLQRNIALDNARRQKELDAKAKQRADALGKARDLDMSALPPAYVSAGNRELEKIFKEVESGALDPQSVEYDRRLTGLKNTLGGLRTEFAQNKELGVNKFVADPSGNVTLFLDPKTGKYTNAASDLSESFGNLWYDENQTFDDINKNIQLAKAAYGETKPVNQELPKTISTELKGAFKDLLQEKYGLPEQFSNDEYNLAYTKYKELGEGEFDRIVDNLKLSYGDDAARYLVSEKGETTKDEVENWIESFVPKEFGTEAELKAKKAKEQEDRQANIKLSSALSEGAQKRVAKFRSGLKGNEELAWRVGDGGRVTIGQGDPKDTNMEYTAIFSTEGASLTVPESVDIIDSYTNETVKGVSNLQLKDGAFITIVQPDGDVVPYWKGNAEYVTYDSKKDKQITEKQDILVPLSKVTGKFKPQADAFVAHAKALTAENRKRKDYKPYNSKAENTTPQESGKEENKEVIEW